MYYYRDLNDNNNNNEGSLLILLITFEMDGAYPQNLKS